jgi:hypothetical protein
LTPFARRFLIVLLFGLNLIFGYLAMLVAMTYSMELFLCVVFGLCLGHFVFNTKSAVGESIDPCCASQQMANGNGSDRIPITRTPCDLEGQSEDSEDDPDEGQSGPSTLNHCSKDCKTKSKNGSINSKNNGYVPTTDPPPYTQDNHRV